jgi:hypothetical protein
MIGIRYDIPCALDDIAAGVAGLQHFCNKHEQREDLLARLPEIDDLLVRLQAVRNILAKTTTVRAQQVEPQPSPRGRFSRA